MLRYALVAWTLFIWATRIRNVVADDGGLAELVVPVGLVLVAVATLVDRRSLPLLAAVTVVVWLVRVPLVLSRDHDAAFVVVHVALALVSISLAVLALRADRRASRRVPA